MFIWISLLLLLLVVLLSMPISLRFEFEQHRTHGNEIVVTCFFGLVNSRILLQEKATSKPSRKMNKPKEQEERNEGKAVFKVLLQKRFRHRIFETLSDLWCSISKHNIKLHIKAGLDDPADTGQLWAIVGPTSALLPSNHQFSVLIEPDFLNPSFQFDCRGTIRFIPLQIIFILVKLFFSPPFWKGLWYIRAENQQC
jgi:hypothetical protein